MDQKTTLEIETITLKEYFETIIRMNNGHVLELMKQDKDYVREAFETFNNNLDVHLDRLNHSHESIKEIALRNISQDKFDMLHKELTLRIEAIEKKEFEQRGQTRMTIIFVVFIAGLASSAITLLIQHFLK